MLINRIQEFELAILLVCNKILYKFIRPFVRRKTASRDVGKLKRSAEKDAVASFSMMTDNILREE